MKVHELKCRPPFFRALRRGEKTFEIRANDRDYHAGDVLHLREHSPSEGYTGAAMWFTATFLFDHLPGLRYGYVAMSVKRIRKPKKAEEKR